MVTTEIAKRAKHAVTIGDVNSMGDNNSIEDLNSALTVAATVLGERPFRFETLLVEPDQVPLMFLCPHQIVINAPVKLQTEDRLWMGRVLRCVPEGDQWRTAIAVEHSLSNLHELLNLAARFE